MSSLPPADARPAFSGNAPQAIKRAIKQGAPHFGAVTASDSVHFGGQADHSTQTPEPFHNTPQASGLRLWDRTKASLTGLTRGLLKDKWGRDLMISLGIFLFTLPLAYVLPGSHFILIPGYIALRRSLRAISGFSKGLMHPDKILKPAAE